MSTPIDNYIQSLREEAEQLSAIQQSVENANKKSDIAVSSVGTLLESLNENIKELFQGIAESQTSDKAAIIMTKISESLSEFSKMKHEIKLSPSFVIDVTPLQKILAKNLEQNAAIFKLIEKINDKEPNKELGIYLEKMNSIDYTPQLEAISKNVINQNKEWEIEVTKRDDIRGFIQKATIKAK